MAEQILPLLATTWGQGNDAPHEYAQCVADLGGWTNDNIGCQCLAVAQILFHHRLQPHPSDQGFYTCTKDGEPDRLVNLVFGNDYFFPQFPPAITSATGDLAKLLLQSYLFDVAKAYRKNFYRGYLLNWRDRVRQLATHFDIEAATYKYLVGESLGVAADRPYEDLDGDSRLTLEDAKLLIKRELSQNRPLSLYVDYADPAKEEHAMVVDGFKEDDDGKFSVCVKWGHPDPRGYNSDPEHPTDPGAPWFDLEGPIGNRDGTLRRLITIRPRRQLMGSAYGDVDYSDLDTIHGRITQLQTEQVSSRATLRCRVEPEEATDLTRFYAYLDGRDREIVYQHFDVLRDALVHRLRVRVLYNPNETEGNYRRLYDVRAYKND